MLMDNGMQIKADKPSLVLVTGYSGAGKSTVLRALEDIGFFCVDNLPLTLLDSFFDVIMHADSPHKRVALGIDVRGGDSKALAAHIKSACNKWPDIISVLFLTASSAVLLRRFQETRRKHPLAQELAISTAIEQEKKTLQPVRSLADITVETDQFTAKQLRAFVRSSFAREAKQNMLVHVVSFGFKYGAPPESNFVYDVRSLPNPYFVPELRPLSGKDAAIREYLFAQDEVQEYWQRLADFSRYAIRKSYEEGRTFMNIAIGCTGGRHRSVAFVQELVGLPVEHVHFLLTHRDIERD